MFNPIFQIIENNLPIKLKIFYFSLEISKEEKMLMLFSNLLYLKEGIRISPTDLKSTKRNKMVSEDVIAIIKKYEHYYEKFEEIVEFHEDIGNPYGIYSKVRSYALENGKIHYKKVVIDNSEVEVEDYYEPNDPDEYVIIIIDAAGLIKLEKNNSLRESIGTLSNNYLIKLRNRFKYTPVLIQQQALEGENLEHRKAGHLRPTSANLADNKGTSRDFNVLLGIFSPFKNELPEYFGYDITMFKDNIRFLEIILSREGGGGTISPLYFDGVVNYFKELPLPRDKENIEKVKNLIKKIREVS